MRTKVIKSEWPEDWVQGDDIDVSDWMEAIDYRITEGFDYNWNCFGENVIELNSWDGDHSGFSTDIVFNNKTKHIYAIDLCDFGNEKAWRYIDPEYREQYLSEAKNWMVDPEREDIAWEGEKGDVLYDDRELEEIIMMIKEAMAK